MYKADASPSVLPDRRVRSLKVFCKGFAFAVTIHGLRVGYVTPAQ